MYQPHEVEISRRCLQAVISEVRKPICILGGWAVYLTVGGNYMREHGMDYIGSRDIDLGFHIERNWGRSELESSGLALAIKMLEGMGYESLGFRFVKHFHMETGKELSEEDAKKAAPYQIFDLYVDPIVDFIHPMVREVFGFVPIDEPLLEHVFVGRRCKGVEFFGRSVLLPLTEVLLATKLKSVCQRSREYKKTKDLADIYALLWYSDYKFPTLKEKLSMIISIIEVRRILSNITMEDLNAVSYALGIDALQIQRVLNEIGS